MIDCRDRYHVANTSRIETTDLSAYILVSVTGSSYYNRAFYVMRIGNRVDQNLRGWSLTAPAQIDYRSTFVRSVNDRVGQIFSRAAAGGVETFDSHDFGVRRDADHAQPVIAPRCDRAADVSAMTMIIHRVVVAGGSIEGHKVPAMPVIDQSIAIIIDTVGRLAGTVGVEAHLTVVQPNISRDVFVVVVKTSVDYGDEHAIAL